MTNMTRFLLTILFTTLTATTCLAALADQDFKSQVDAVVLPFMKSHDIPGTAVALYFQGQEYIFDYGYANLENKTPVSDDTIFDIMSITKVFTATVFANECYKGVVNLSDPMVKYFPLLSKTQNLPIDQVTLADLATHTSSLPKSSGELGIPNNNNDIMIAKLKTWIPKYKIGTTFIYSNFGYGLLGEAMVNVTGSSYYDLLNKLILLPLNMHETIIEFPTYLLKYEAVGYKVDGTILPTYHPTYLYGGVALRSSIKDMLSFLKAIIGVGVVNNYTDLKNAIMLSRMAFFQLKPNFVMGLGWQRIFRNNQLFITKNGGNDGFDSFIGVSDKKSFGVVVLSNKGKSDANKLGNELLDLMAAK